MHPQKKSQPLLERGDEDLISSVVAKETVVGIIREGEALPVVEPFKESKSFAQRSCDLIRPKPSTFKLRSCINQTCHSSSNAKGVESFIVKLHRIDVQYLHQRQSIWIVCVALTFSWHHRLLKNFGERVIFSMDWHQVLDAIRLSSSITIRPIGYQLLTEARRALQQLRDTFPNCVIVINSYCCSEPFRVGVASAYAQTDLIDICITTTARTGFKGKLAAAMTKKTLDSLV